MSAQTKFQRFAQTTLRPYPRKVSIFSAGFIFKLLNKKIMFFLTTSWQMTPVEAKRLVAILLQILSVNFLAIRLSLKYIDFSNVICSWLFCLRRSLSTFNQSKHQKLMLLLKLRFTSVSRAIKLRPANAIPANLIVEIHGSWRH